MLLLSESLTADGGMLLTWLARRDHGLVLRIEQRSAAAQTSVELSLPEGAVQAVMRRYAKPLDEALEIEVSSLSAGVTLEDSSSLCRFRFRPRYDVIAKDYAVWRVPGEPSQAELATSVAAALRHLARASAGRLVLGG